MRPVIFLDDGGVMNDNEQRGVQWRRLVGVYLGPRFGGSQEAWEQANRIVADRLFAEYLHRIGTDPYHDVQAFRDDWNDRWLAEMCQEVGVAFPADRAERIRIAEEAAAYITRRVRAAVPGVESAIQQLSRAGYILHTASGEHSSELEGYLSGLGVLKCFGTLYGPDLVGTPKAGPLYYRRVFDHARVLPSQALVVDDSETALGWAAAVGARTLLCRPVPPRAALHQHIRSLTKLPRFLMYHGDV